MHGRNQGSYIPLRSVYTLAGTDSRSLDHKFDVHLHHRAIGEIVFALVSNNTARFDHGGISGGVTVYCRYGAALFLSAKVITV